MDKAVAFSFSSSFIKRWNAGDIDGVMKGFRQDVVAFSPVRTSALRVDGSWMLGGDELAAHFRVLHASYPAFELVHSFSADSFLNIVVRCQTGELISLFGELDERLRVRRLIACYDDLA